MPFLTSLAPSQRYDQQQQRRHKTLTDWGRQMIKKVRRWLPQRELFVVADSSFAALELLAAVSQMTNSVHMITLVAFGRSLVSTCSTPPARTDGTTAT